MDRPIFNISDNILFSAESGSDSSESDEYSSVQSDYSVISESNCFSYHTDEPSTTNTSLAKSKKSINLLQKLYFREIRGNFSPHPRAPNLRLFNSVPAENKICLQHVLPESAFHTNHVFLGLSKCGRFLLSYTHSIELDVIIFNNVHKYRLHWWSFVPHQRARKVAEVMLFGNQGVYCDLHISVCQWPIDTTKLLIYGYCVHTDHCQFGHSHLTITTVPSLNTCRDCLKVAASYEEEDLAAIWDSCVRFSCLKHGLTIHSNFDVVSPYPTFNPQVSMKRDGMVVFNTGNFLHILRADLESFGGTPGVKGVEPLDCREYSVQRVSEGGHREVTEVIGTSPRALEPYKNLDTKDDLPATYLGRFLDACDPPSTPNESTSQARRPFDVPGCPSRVRDCTARIDKLKQEIEEGRAESERLKEEASTESRQFWSTLEEMTSSLNPACSAETSSDSSDAFASLVNSKTVQGADVSAPLNACDKTYVYDEAEPSTTGPECNATLCLEERREQLQTVVRRDGLTQREKAVRDFQNEVFSSQRRTMPKTKPFLIKEELDVPKTGERNASPSDDCGVPNFNHFKTDMDLGEDVEWSHSVSEKISNTISSYSKDFIPHTVVSINQNTSTQKMGNVSKLDENGCVSSCDKSDDVYIVNSMFDSSMELNITCSSSEEPSKVSLRSSRSLLMVSTGDASDSREDRRRLELSPCRKDHAGSNVDAQRKLRKPRGGLVKIGSSPPSSSPKLGTAQVSVTPPGTPPKLAAETIYEFTDDQPDNSEKLSSFRRRRLAEKKYEFCEEGEDAENIVPFRLLRNREMSPRLRSPPIYLSNSTVLTHRRRAHEDSADALTSPRSPNLSIEIQTLGSEQDKAVLRPLNRNLVAITLLSPRETERDRSKPNVRKLAIIEPANEGCLSEVALQKGTKDEVQTLNQAGNVRYKCTVQFKRRYIEVDDELVSTTTDIEDEDCVGSAPYHFALPLEIHGAGYVQLQMISNSKAEKLNGAPGVVVHQMSFDVEAFCHEVAQRLCEAAGKKYCFCVDYDVEIIDVCIITGDVLVLAIMRIEAIIVSKGLAKSLRRGEIMVSGQRNQYQGGCTFVWNTETGAHRVVATSPLIESSAMDDTQEPWGPAKSHVQTLRQSLPQVPMCHPVRSITNRPVFSEESYKCLSDLDNLISLVL